ncbi:MAG: winged helix-turn-helix transcriptional regulator [Solirubrobacteraceae bacterium]|jgi:hypothetical protein
MRSGRGGVPEAIVWVLPPAKATFHLQAHDKLGTTARRGHGPQRVLDAVIAAAGRASQAQLAGLLGLTPQTVGQHCRLLELRGQLSRGGLDKSTSNRGSQVWNLAPRQRPSDGRRTLRLSAGSSSTRPLAA